MHCFLVLLNTCNMNIFKKNYKTIKLKQMLKHIVSFYIKDIDCNITKLFWNIKKFRFFSLSWLYDRKFNMTEMFD